MLGHLTVESIKNYKIIKINGITKINIFNFAVGKIAKNNTPFVGILSEWIEYYTYAYPHISISMLIEKKKTK